MHGDGGWDATVVPATCSHAKWLDSLYDLKIVLFVVDCAGVPEWLTGRT